ncbi:WGR domain-containing protein [Deinococcus detaillensis]|uniref:WGR domain-containing protein n=1 Tax=Deinococcus detaillensis TaxID=2592048 RepID=A0A553V152_9DEIO|nr:WGR domain-containing protein [Deinococcus detaillensis]TSA86199.1 WGR domain-containing protein [Deinococcus detaillensis]
MSKTYLELSDEVGSEHKFYEVSVEETTLTLRFGRIGTPGQTSTKGFATAEQAEAEAAKKIKEKVRKGYKEAVQGVRQKRSVVRREITETASTTKSAAPVVWKFKTSSAAFGIFADRDNVWVGNDAGEVYALSPEGEVQRSFKLPEGVKCLVSDQHRTFAGCDDGNVYDLSGKLPFVAYEAESQSAILWMDLQGGMLGVGDSQGNVHAFDAESEQQWAQIGQNAHMAWMVRVDQAGVYYGHSGGVGQLDRESGFPLWHHKTSGSVLFGWQEGSDLYAGTSNNQIQRFTKTGQAVQNYRCDAAVFSCATSPEGEFVFAGDSSSAVYCFNKAGERLWKLGTSYGAALSMQYSGERLYIVTSRGTLAALDVSAQAIENAKQGIQVTARDIKMAATLQTQAPATTFAVTSQIAGQVVLKVVQEGGKLRVKPDSERNSQTFQDWNVQFPRTLRRMGVSYVVDQLEDAGGFYRVVGEIRQLEE